MKKQYLTTKPISRRARVFVHGLLLVLVCMQVVLFMQGYRQSADDAGLSLVYLQGWDAIWGAGHAVAQDHGRVGMYAIGPINAFASYWSAHPAVQALFVFLHFMVLVLFARLAGRWFGHGLGDALAVVLVVAHPLAFEHMPPNAYALQNTLPFLLLLGARLVAPVTQGPNTGLRRGMAVCCWAIFTLALLLNEYAFVFGLAIVSMEIWLGLERAGKHAWSPSGLAGILGSHAPALLGLVVAAVAYAAYRALHPSNYDGNTADAIGQVVRWIKTSLHHVLAGTMLVRLDSSVAKLPMAGLASASGFAIVAWFATRRARFYAETTNTSLASAAVALMLAIAVVMPVTSSAKQQGWCLEVGSCGFLDSRMAYLWLVLTCVLVAHRVLQSMSIPWWQVASVRTFAVVVGIAAFITFSYNWLQSDRMWEASQPWRRADALACMPDSAEKFRSRIDPGDAIVMHAWINRETYWRTYVFLKRAAGTCRGRAD